MDFTNIDSILDSGAKLGGGAGFAYMAFRLARYALDWLERKLGHDAARIEKLEGDIIPLAQKAALADHLTVENARLVAENAELREAVREKDIHLVQKDTVVQGIMPLMKYLTHPAVQGEIRALVEAEKQEQEKP